MGTCAPHDEAKPRIAIGTWEISGFVDTLTNGFEALGYDVTSAVRAGDSHFHDSLYDLDLEKDVPAVSWDTLTRRVLGPEPAPRRLTRKSTPAERLHWLIARHDVFVFVYASLYPDRFCRPVRMGVGREFELLRRLGKRIVCVHVGPEVRHVSAFDQERAQHEREAAGDAEGRRGTASGAGVSLASTNPRWSKASVSVPMRNLRRAELHADAIFSQPNQASLALRPYHHLFAPVNLSRFRAEVPGRERPVVIHAPSVRSIKGTDTILAALERLRARGVDFELRIFDTLPNGELMQQLREADVVVDQLHLPLHGRLGVEAMASGCALATCNDERFEPFPAQRPIWHLDAGNVEARLHTLLTNRALRMRLGREGARYTRRWHDHVRVAERIARVLGPRPPAPEHHPEFFARHYRAPAPIPRALRALNDTVATRVGLPAGASRESLRARGLI